MDVEMVSEIKNFKLRGDHKNQSRGEKERQITDITNG
jgi:hypothetical protein